MTRLAAAALLVLALAACREEAAAPPPPVAMTAESVGHFCQMGMLEHPGPKAQVFLEGMPNPLFFSQVRDAIAFQRLPEQEARIVATYVSDMARAPNWETPGPTNWLPAADAWYVTGSTRAGGMGAPETVPFGTEAAGRAFVAQWGGELRRLDDIPTALVLEAAPVATGAPAAADEQDYTARLEALDPAAAPTQETTP